MQSSRRRLVTESRKKNCLKSTTKNVIDMAKAVIENSANSPKAQPIPLSLAALTMKKAATLGKDRIEWQGRDEVLQVNTSPVLNQV